MMLIPLDPQTDIHPYFFKSGAVQTQKNAGIVKNMLRAASSEGKGVYGILQRMNEGLEASQIHGSGNAPPHMTQPGSHKILRPVVAVPRKTFKGRQISRIQMTHDVIGQRTAGGNAVRTTGGGEHQIARSLHINRPLLQKNIHDAVHIPEKGRGPTPMPSF